MDSAFSIQQEEIQKVLEESQPPNPDPIAPSQVDQNYGKFLV